MRYAVSIIELQGEQNGCKYWGVSVGNLRWVSALIEIDASHCGLNRVYSCTAGWHLSSEDNCRQPDGTLGEKESVDRLDKSIGRSGLTGLRVDRLNRVD